MEAVVALLALVGAWAAIRGARLFRRGCRDADHPSASLRVIRGIRGLVVAVSTWAFAGGVFFGQTWLLVFGTVFLAEELYETGVVALILRSGERSSQAPTSAPVSATAPAGAGAARSRER